MEQDLERSEEKVEHSDRYLFFLISNNFLFLILFFNKISNIFFVFHSKIVELEEELRVVGNNLKSLEVSEEKVRKI